MNGISIDPDVKLPGFAIWRGGELIRCGVGSVVDVRSLVLAECHRGARAIVEVPMYWPGRRRSDPQSLIELALVAGQLGGPSAAYVTVNRWKGSTPKAIQNRRTRERLCDRERAILDAALGASTRDQALEILDAVGIGLWALRSEGARDAP